MRNHVSDKETIHKFLEGDADQVALVTSWIRDVVKSLSSASSHVTDDIVGDTLFKLLNNFRSNAFLFESSLKTYVQSVARYTMIDALRHQKLRNRYADLLDADGSPDPLDLHKNTEDFDLLGRVFSLIDAPCRELWNLIFFEGKSYKEITRLLNISEATVKTRAFRCKEKALEIKRRLL